MKTSNIPGLRTFAVGYHNGKIGVFSRLISAMGACEAAVRVADAIASEGFDRNSLHLIAVTELSAGLPAHLPRPYYTGHEVA